MAGDRELTPLMEEYEEETGKKAKWGGELTKGYKKWRRDRRRSEKRAQKMLDKLDERLVNGEISEDTYRELKAKYESQVGGVAKPARGKPRVKTCPECGHENPSRAEFCAECGAEITSPAEEGDVVRFKVPGGPEGDVVRFRTKPRAPERYGEKPPTLSGEEVNKYGNYALICGIVGFLLVGIVLGPVAMYYGSKASATGKGKAGMILGALSFSLSIIGLFLLAV